MYIPTFLKNILVIYDISTHTHIFNAYGSAYSISIIVNIYENFTFMLCGTFFSMWLGPKPKTIRDFWKMIWQEKVCDIVCLTNLKEGTKVKNIKTISESLTFNDDLILVSKIFY